MKEADSMTNKQPVGGAVGDLRVTVKGLALLAAINVHMVPKIKGVYDDERFNRFWAKLQEMGFFSYLRKVGPGKPGMPTRTKTTANGAGSPAPAEKAPQNVAPSVGLDGAVQARRCTTSKKPAGQAGMEFRLTAKGLAYLAAISVGLIPEVDSIYDADLFNKFWAELHESEFFPYVLSLGPDAPLSSKAVEKWEKGLY